jgi:three-Cys-motif partner protein
MDIRLEPQEDGLPMRKSGRWVIEKLHYLRCYIEVFAVSMHRKPWRATHYIDLFAGPGKCSVPDTNTIHLGSALLALQASPPFKRLFFADLEPGHISALEQRCRSSPLFDCIRFFVGDSNVKVREIMQRISEIDGEFMPGVWPSLNLAFLDPEGLELRWDTVAALASANRMDLIIHYPEGGLNRMMKRAHASTQDTAVDGFFGDRGWRGIYEAHGGKRGVHRKLLDHFKAKLRQLGYVDVRGGDEVGYEPLVRNVKRRAPLYRLIFASKHPLGNEFWEKVTSRDVYGQMRLLETGPRY